MCVSKIYIIMLLTLCQHFFIFYFCCHLFRCDSNKNYIIFVVICQLLFLNNNWTSVQIIDSVHRPDNFPFLRQRKLFYHQIFHLSIPFLSFSIFLPFLSFLWAIFYLFTFYIFFISIHILLSSNLIYQEATIPFFLRFCLIQKVLPNPK